MDQKYCGDMQMGKGMGTEIKLQKQKESFCATTNAPSNIDLNVSNTQFGFTNGYRVVPKFAQFNTLKQNKKLP